ncbi:MAG: hypothetical protein OEO20_11850 [Gemmatimonadota bacterium]|nr:hypothetical protein [Gemmatimonadota bacterium]MDH3368971.1 hypothetical protein [Gemmatimonadota bacterium]MDH3478988.1 hypothetical protein [Gemmatimonadota bacterium]MDH3570584.1 hypothetical protein [Gemmatimonadota bacterium]MDH5549685.1 hypothetical protein [Gemmatimonadota bacterium]
MRTFQILSVLLLASLAACGGSALDRLDTQTFQLQHLDAQEAAQLIDPYVYHDREGAPGRMGHAGNTLTVRETKDNLDKISRVLTEFDRPKPGVRLHFQIIEASDRGPAEQFDPAIADVEAELRKLFKYQRYRLLNDAVVGGTEGSHIEQAVGDITTPDGNSWMITANIGTVRAFGDSGSVELRVGIRSPYRGTLETTVNARAGQTIVVGNAQLASGGGTVILTVKPEFVQ